MREQGWYQQTQLQLLQALFEEHSAKERAEERNRLAQERADERSRRHVAMAKHVYRNNH